MARASSPAEMDTFQFLEWLETASAKELEAFARDPRDPYVLMRQEMRAMTALMRRTETRRAIEEGENERWRPASTCGHWEWG
jgi:hypothetical protein